MQTAVPDKKSLLEQLISHRKNIRAFGVQRLSLFGSFATGNIHPGSNIDFLVDFESNKKTYDNFFGLISYLEELLGRKVKLVTPLSLGKHIDPHNLKQTEPVAI